MALQSLRNSHWLQAGILSALLFGSLILWIPGWYKRVFPEFPLRTVAWATAQHSELALQLTQSMVAVRTATNALAGSISPARLEMFADLTVPYSVTVKDGLLSIAEVTGKIRDDQSRPFAFVTATLRRLFKRLTSIASSLEIVYMTHGNTQKESIKSLYAWDIARDLPPHLASIESWLDESRDRCEIAVWSQENVIPRLEALRRPLGLIRPWWLLWWKARAWDRSAEVQRRQMLFAMTYDVYKLMGQYCEAIEKTRHSTAAYISHEGIFKPVDQLISAEGKSEGKSMEDLLSLLAGNLDKMGLLIQKVQEELRFA